MSAAACTTAILPGLNTTWATRNGAVTDAPHHVAGFRIARLLARGRTALVYLAHDAAQRPVALKVARQRDLRALGADNFRAEFDAAVALGHPHAIRALRHGVEDGTAWLALEHAGGGTVQQQAGCLDDHALRTMLAQAARALARLHALGRVHRDVKSANLLVRDDGSVALADFGSTCAEGTLPQPPGALFGSPQYAAPEQASGAAASPAGDVYGLGIVLHELLTGSLPFPGQTPQELLAQHLVAPAPRLPAARAAWQPLLDALLAKAPATRPADGQAVLSLLAQLAPPGSRTPPAPAS